MTLKNYQEQAKRTCPSLGSLKLDLSHMVLGMCSEVSELQDAIINQDRTNIGEEIADIEWYLSNYFRFREWDYDIKTDNIFYKPKIKSLNYSISNLQDVIKKFIAYDKEIDQEYEYQLLTAIFTEVQLLYKRFDLDGNAWRSKNIEKLKKRYPEKFTTQNALNRDLEAERKILEK